MQNSEYNLLVLEKDTRPLVIDERLGVAGWDVNDSSRVSEEWLVHFSADRIAEGTGSIGYCDYALLDRVGTPIAIVEAK